MRKIYLLLLTVVFFSCGSDDGGENPPSGSSPNILLVIADDMGKDATLGFSEGSLKPNTPNLDGMRSEGLVFNNFWATPTCSPTRAAMITGKYGYRTGVKWAGDELAASETILHKYISEELSDSYSTAIVGKWHLSGNNTSVNPEIFGMDYYSGLLKGTVQDYYSWQLSESGVVNLETQYVSKTLTDKAMIWIADQSKPWFLWLAYNAPHTPFHAPPTAMHSQGDLPDFEEGADPMPYYLAAIEAMDFQIGRLLDNMSETERENTIIIFMGDNGTPNQVAQSPYSPTTVKGSLYQGGINVPMFVSGAGVGRSGSDDNLICSTDIFSTVADLAGVNNHDIHDGKSFKAVLNVELTLREFQYSEMNSGNQDLWAISNGKFKLIVNANGSEEMYDLSADPYEGNNLLEATLTSAQENAKIDLETELLLIRN